MFLVHTRVRVRVRVRVMTNGHDKRLLALVRVVVRVIAGDQLGCS
jgi:hypothetical protein